MSKTLTPRELLEQYPGQTVLKPAPRIEADLPLKNKALDRLIDLFEDDAIQGLEVITTEGESLGFISHEAMREYIEAKLFEEPTMGGNIGKLEGDLLSDAPLFRCDRHNPPDEILVAIARPNLLKCSICGQPMQRVE